MTAHTSDLTGILPDGAGRLWTMHRNHCIAVCAIHGCVEGWDIRISVNAETLHFASRGCSEEAFALAEQWKILFEQQGWSELGDSTKGALKEMTSRMR